MSTPSHPGDPCCETRKWYLKKVWWMVGAAFLAGSLTPFFSLSEPFARAFWDYVKIIGWAVGAGLVMGGIIERFVPKEYISRVLARPRKRTILYATGLGLLASACSHGILALSMELHKKGASGPAVISFLLASPWANFPVTLLLVGLFGWRGLCIILAALGIALTTGLIFQWLDKRGWIERNKQTAILEDAFDIRSDFRKRVKNYRFSFSRLVSDLREVAKGTAGLSEMVLGWVTLGVVLASLAQAYVPASLFRNYLGPGLPGLLVTLGFATVLEVCSEGTAPLAFEIYRQTGALGNSFVFLSAGVLTDYTEIGLIWSNLGKRTALWMVAVGVPQALLVGWLFNQLF